MRTRFDSSSKTSVICGKLNAVCDYFLRNRLITFILAIFVIWGVVVYNFYNKHSSDTVKKHEIVPKLTKDDIFDPKSFLKNWGDPDYNDKLKALFGNDKPMIDNRNNNNDNNENNKNNNKNDNRANDNNFNDLNNENDELSIEEKVKNGHKIVITYGQNCCQSAKRRMCETALAAGKADECFAYDASVMDKDFATKNANILKQGRGAGYWLWKPYIIYKHLTDPNLPDGSYIAYSDAGAKLVGDVKHALTFMEENDDIYKGVLFFGVGFDQKNFCKRDAFILQDCDRQECYDAMQINAFVAFFRKCDYSRMVVKTWLDECQDERILTDMANTQGKPNLPGFRDHRHDQAVITNVMNAHGWKYDTTNGPVLDKVFYHDRFKG